MNDLRKGKILLTGATGEVGGQVLQLLKKDEVPFRILCRKEAQLSKFKDDNVDAVLGDLSDKKSLYTALEGCSTLFLLTAATPTQLEQDKNAISAAVEAGVNHIIRISAADARDECAVPWITAHAAADRYLIDQDLQWTILKTSAFMQNLLPFAGAIQRGFLPQTSGDGKVGWVDTADIAACARRIILDGPAQHAGKTYILTGPQLLSMPEIAGIFSDVLGYRVRYIHLPGPVFQILLRLAGIDGWMAQGLERQFVDIVRANKEGIEVSGDVPKLAGQAPTSFAEFATARKGQLAPQQIVPTELLEIGTIGAAAIAFLAYMLATRSW